MELPACEQVSCESPPMALLFRSAAQSNTRCSLTRRLPAPKCPFKSPAMKVVRNRAGWILEEFCIEVARYMSQKGVGCNNIPIDFT